MIQALIIWHYYLVTAMEKVRVLQLQRWNGRNSSKNVQMHDIDNDSKRYMMMITIVCNG